MYKSTEGILYDWHNSIKLHNQNKDIDFFKNIIGKNKGKKILVVGAGTGRVAIPLSEENYVYALDINKQRLYRIKEKSDLNNIEIICKDISKYKSNIKFDFIIFPYSTIQNIYPELKQIKALKNIRKILNKDGLCIIDTTNSFSEFKNTGYIDICNGFCKEFSTEITEKEKVIVHKKYIILNKKFVDENDIIILKKKERWNIFDEKKFEEIIFKTKFNIVEKIKGYDNTTTHRTIYILNKGEK